MKKISLMRIAALASLFNLGAAQRVAMTPAKGTATNKSKEKRTKGKREYSLKIRSNRQKAKKRH